MNPPTIYWVSDGKLEPKPFFSIKLAAEYADKIKGLVILANGQLVYSWGESAVLIK